MLVSGSALRVGRTCRRRLLLLLLLLFRVTFSGRARRSETPVAAASVLRVSGSISVDTLTVPTDVQRRRRDGTISLSFSPPNSDEYDRRLCAGTNDVGVGKGREHAEDEELLSGEWQRPCMCGCV